MNDFRTQKQFNAHFILYQEKYSNQFERLYLLSSTHRHGVLPSKHSTQSIHMIAHSALITPCGVCTTNSAINILRYKYSNAIVYDVR